jgi:heme oxygenase
MLSEKIKEETKQAHQSLEKIIVGHIKSVQSAEDYKTLLQLLYSYYFPLEILLDEWLNDGLVPFYSQRRKAESILHDINAVPDKHSPATLCTDLPPVNNIAAAFGALYVLEGSTLGGTYIAKMLSKQAGIPAMQLTFFNGYAGKSMEMWNAFITALNHYAETSGAGAEIMQSAKNTFEKFEQWTVNIADKRNAVHVSNEK